MFNVVHITPHLGGGVGKALSELISQAHGHGGAVKHIVICLEKPERSHFLNRIREANGEVMIAPDQALIDALIATSDIVQLEWWNHPETIRCLCALKQQPIRLLTWCHVSGLFNPIIPQRLIESSNRFLLTSKCSLEAYEVSSLSDRFRTQVSVVPSGGGLDRLPDPNLRKSDPISVGYFGSFNYSKLHPSFLSFISLANRKDLTVKMIGTPANRETIESQCPQFGLRNVLRFRDYTTDIAAELANLNVLAYILNPTHYGTSENTLLEAMAMGIVPIVLDNPAERNIVEHMKTGLIIHTPAEFADAINWLIDNPESRVKIGTQASETVRKVYTNSNMELSFRSHYSNMMREEKKEVLFADVFGNTPDEWFLTCQSSPEIFKDDGSVTLPEANDLTFSFLERTKGSVFHFAQHFPAATKLRMWANNISSTQ